MCLGRAKVVVASDDFSSTSGTLSGSCCLSCNMCLHNRKLRRNVSNNTTGLQAIKSDPLTCSLLVLSMG